MNNKEWRKHLKKAGSKGGKAVHKKYGSDYMRKIGKKGNKARYQ